MEIVAPFAGAWIEIKEYEVLGKYRQVAPFAGAWIEIDAFASLCVANWSLPSRERGLKFRYVSIKFFWWSRSLRGSED